MPTDDEPDDASASSPPPSPDDRLWRHPSELGSAQPVVIVSSRGSRRKVATIGLLSGALGAAAALALVMVMGGFHRGNTVAVEQVQLPQPSDPAPSELAIAQRVMPAMARVDVSKATGTSSGTALVYRNDGHLVTSADVVDGAESVSVQLPDASVVPAQVIGVDRSSDVAVIKIDRTQMPTAVLGVKAQLVLGQPAIAIECVPGKPGSPDISVGLISALGRRVDAADGSSLHDMIQTNVRISATGSGAALIDSTGAVIGLVTRRGQPVKDVAQHTTGTGTAATLVPRYATPIDYVKQVADELVLNGRVAHPWLGVESSDLSEAEVSQAGRAGARIVQVAPGSPAEIAGLQPGDVVISVDDHAVSTSSDLVVALRTHKPADSVSITYLRDGSEQETSATLAENVSVP